MENTLNVFFESAKSGLTSEYAKKIVCDIEKSGDLQNTFENLKCVLKGLLVVPKWTVLAAILIIFAVIFEIFKHTFKSESIIAAVSYSLRILLCSLIMLPTFEMLSQVMNYMRETATFLGILAPTLGTLSAAGGNVISAGTTSTSLSVLISIFQVILNTVAPFVCALFSGIAIIDCVNIDGKMLVLSNIVKNICYTLFSVAVALFFIILGTKTLAAAGADRFSAKALRVIVGTSVPIVGGTLGEAIKLVGGSIVALRNTVGIGAVAFLLSMYIPPLFILWWSGILLDALAFLCDYFGVAPFKNIFLHIKHMLCFMLAAFASTFVLGMLNIGVFMQTMPALMT